MVLEPNESQALDVVQGCDADLVFLSPTVFPVQTPRYLPDDELAERRSIVAQAVRTAERSGFGGSVTGVVRIGRNFDRLITNAVDEHSIDTVVLAVRGRSDRLGQLRGTTAEQIAAHADCNVVSMQPTPIPERIASILVPVAGGPHSGLAVDIAGALQRTHDAWVDLLHVIDTDPSQSELNHARALVMAGLDRLDQYDTASPWVLEAPDVTAAIIEQTTTYDMTVIGAPRTRGLKRFVLGSTTDAVRTGVFTTPVVTAENRTRSGLQPPTTRR